MMMKSFKQYAAEEAPTNSTGSAVDMNPTGRKAKKTFPKMFDRRSRFDAKKVFDKANGR